MNIILLERAVRPSPAPAEEQPVAHVAPAVTVQVAFAKGGSVNRGITDNHAHEHDNTQQDMHLPHQTPPLMLLSLNLI